MLGPEDTGPLQPEDPAQDIDQSQDKDDQYLDGIILGEEQ